MKKRKRLLGAAAIVALSVALAGCESVAPAEGETAMSDENLGEKDKTASYMEENFTPEVVGSYEAEAAKLNGSVKTESKKSGFSGEGYVTGFEEDADSCMFQISIPEDGFYDLDFISSAEGGYKENYVYIDGASAGTVNIEESTFSDSVLSRVYLTKGEHEIGLVKYWGWINLDKLEVKTAPPISESIYQVSAELVNENATDSAKRLMSFLADSYGEKILSGQYCDTGEFGKEFAVIKKETGKTPAVLGLDFIEYSPSRVANGSTSNATDYAIKFWEDGGIVTFCWHWNPPEKYLTQEWYRGFYKEATNIDLAKIMNGEDEEGYQLLMEDIDAIAKQLLILQEADVPILWRPLHEASGGWFWWGNAGADAYKKLYILLYDKLTKEYGLNNLIWLWNGQDGEWYPGDEYVDIIGEDIYPGEQVYNSQVNKYLEAVQYTSEKKMVVLSENGCLFDPELAVRDGAMWGFFCTWGGEFVANEGAIYSYSEKYTQRDMLQKIYDSEIVLTLDELPDLKEYPIRDE